jgi:hypothetical protein
MNGGSERPLTRSVLGHQSLFWLGRPHQTTSLFASGMRQAMIILLQDELCLSDRSRAGDCACMRRTSPGLIFH